MTAKVNSFVSPVPEMTTGRKRYVPQNQRRILCAFPKYAPSFGTLA